MYPHFIFSLSSRIHFFMRIQILSNIYLTFSELKEIILGGICFSLSKNGGIAAIHISIISKNYQLKGNGSHLINIFKKILSR